MLSTFSHFFFEVMHGDGIDSSSSNSVDNSTSGSVQSAAHDGVAAIVIGTEGVVIASVLDAIDEQHG